MANNTQRRKETRQKIYIAIQDLLKAKNINDISVQDICKKAGVGVGTFYHYYDTKEDALFDISNPIDLYFSTVVSDEIATCQNPMEKLLLFFQHQADFMNNYVLEHGIATTLKLHVHSFKNFYSTERTTNYMLSDIISEVSCFDEWVRQKNPEWVANYLLCLTRGAVSHWICNNCKYNLREETLDMVKTTCDTLLGKTSVGKG